MKINIARAYVTKTYCSMNVETNTTARKYIILIFPYSVLMWVFKKNNNRKIFVFEMGSGTTAPSRLGSR